MEEWHNPNEDWRGIDITQIRAQLRLTVEDRVRHMVEVANVFMGVRQQARIVRRPDDR
jgi:hypothetical protein